MCEICAINAHRALRANPILNEFFADSPKHPHGWGLSWLRDDSSLWLDKEPLPAYGSEYLRYLLREPIRTPWLITHIRNATRGIVTYDNCHPFRGTDALGTTWVLAHNGTMLAEGDVADLAAHQRGTTDSERVLLRLLALLNDAAQTSGTLDFDATFAIASTMVAELSHGNKLNLVFGDGTYTYVHTNTMQHTLWRHRGAGTTIVCTRPLKDVATPWEPHPRCRLIAYRDGKVVAESKRHDGDFDDDEYLRIIARETPVAPIA